MIKVANTYTPEEIAEYVNEYKSTDVSLSEYTREKNIPISTFRGWLAKDKIKFGEIALDEEKSAPTKRSTSTVIITENIKIELKEGYDKNFLMNLMEVLLRDVE